MIPVKQKHGIYCRIKECQTSCALWKIRSPRQLEKNLNSFQGIAQISGSQEYNKPQIIYLVNFLSKCQRGASGGHSSRVTVQI